MTGSDDLSHRCRVADSSIWREERRVPTLIDDANTGPRATGVSVFGDPAAHYGDKACATARTVHHTDRSMQLSVCPHDDPKLSCGDMRFTATGGCCVGDLHVDPWAGAGNIAEMKSDPPADDLRTAQAEVGFRATHERYFVLIADLAEQMHDYPWAGVVPAYRFIGHYAPRP